MRNAKYHSALLRTPCEFQRKELTSDGAGGFTEEWAPLTGSATMCHFRALSGSERFNAARVEASTRNRIVVRYFPDLTEGDRVVIRGKAYDITFINVVELRDFWMEIDVSGGVAQ